MIDAISTVIGELPEEFYIVGWVVACAFLYTFVLQLLDFIKAVINK